MPEGLAPSHRANKVADWVETQCLIADRPMGVDALEAAGREAGYGHADVALGLNTMARRRHILADAYPFRTANGATALPQAQTSPWVALLLMSRESPVRHLIDISAAAAHLERVTAAATLRMFGPDTRSLRFAWPSEDGRPPEFPQAVRWLAEQMGTKVGQAYRPPYNKDGGVDVVAWRPFPDQRSGFPVMLVQCTLERAHAHKAYDIDKRVWSAWLALDIDPITALAIPEVVAAGEDWNMLAARTLVLDRTRLSALLGADGAVGLPAVVPQWSQEQLEHARNLR